MKNLWNKLHPAAQAIMIGLGALLVFILFVPAFVTFVNWYFRLWGLMP